MPLLERPGAPGDLPPVELADVLAPVGVDAHRRDVISPPAPPDGRVREQRQARSTVARPIGRREQLRVCRSQKSGNGGQALNHGEITRANVAADGLPPGEQEEFRPGREGDAVAAVQSDEYASGTPERGELRKVQDAARGIGGDEGETARMKTRHGRDDTIPRQVN